MEFTNGKYNQFFSCGKEAENRYYISNYKYDRINSSLFFLSERIQQDSVVLDIACGSGKMGHVLNNEKKSCTLYGIEMDPDAAKSAFDTGFYTDIFVFDISNYECAEYNRMCEAVKFVDVIIMSDILEHLSNPTEILLHYLKFLKDTGIILISIPNVSHADISLGLLDGRFNYTQMGILDNTHLKFFTRSSFFQWIELINRQYSMNLHCYLLGTTFKNTEYLDNIKKECIDLFELLTLNPDFNSLQLLFMITAQEKYFDEIVDGEPPPVSYSIFSVVNALCARLKGMESLIKKEDIGLVSSNERLQYEKRLDVLGEYVKNRDARINELKEALSKRDEWISGLKEALSKRDEWISGLKEALSKRDERISGLKEALSKRDERINSFLEYVSHLEKTNSEVNENLTERNKRIEALLVYVSQLEDTVKQRDERIEALLEYVSHLENDVHFAGDTIQQRNERVTELLNYQDNLEGTVKQRDEHVTELLDYQAHLEDTVKKLEQKQEQIQQTIAWKLFLKRKFAKQDH